MPYIQRKDIVKTALKILAQVLREHIIHMYAWSIVTICHACPVVWTSMSYVNSKMNSTTKMQ